MEKEERQDRSRRRLNFSLTVIHGSPGRTVSPGQEMGNSLEKVTFSLNFG